LSGHVTVPVGAAAPFEVYNPWEASKAKVRANGDGCPRRCDYFDGVVNCVEEMDVEIGYYGVTIDNVMGNGMPWGTRWFRSVPTIVALTYDWLITTTVNVLCECGHAMPG